MKATARAHPIQGLVKYHGLKETDPRVPYHDSISVCTAPTHSKTTVEWQPDAAEDVFYVDGEQVSGHEADRIRSVVDHVRDSAGIDHPVRLESENSFPPNIGFGASSSGFAAAAMALCEAAGLNYTRQEISAVARRGSLSAARSVTGAYSQLFAGQNDHDCISRRLTTGEGDDGFHPETDLRTVAAQIPAYKQTERAHEEAEESHMFQARLAHVHQQLAECRDALREGSFDRVFGLAERDSLSLTAATMTGPSGWVYWQPETIAVFNAVRELRREEDIPVYFSTDTGASVYVNTRTGYEDRVEERISELGVETDVWSVGGPAEILGPDDALF